MTAIAPTLQAFFTERLIRQRGPRTAPASSQQPWTGTTWTPQPSARSWTILRPAAATSPGPATCA